MKCLPLTNAIHQCYILMSPLTGRVKDHAFLSLHTENTEISTNSSTRRWIPGLGCPVPRCGAKKIQSTTRLREHWNDKHEEIVPKFQCSLCSHTTKRKSNLLMHFRYRHPEADPSLCVGDISYQHNNEFQDPFPLTIQNILDSRKYHT